MNKYRYFDIISSKNSKYYKLLKELKKKYKQDIKERNKENMFKLDLVGYDGTVKLSVDKFSEKILHKIFNTIDEMPIGKREKVQRGNGRKNYKDKYMKYKSKYMGLKYIIDHFY